MGGVVMGCESEIRFSTFLTFLTYFNSSIHKGSSPFYLPISTAQMGLRPRDPRGHGDTEICSSRWKCSVHPVSILSR